MRKLVNTKDISRDEWLEIRKKSIGGSDAGAIMGMNSYAGPVSVYADKVGISERKETSEAMRLGTDLEGYVASRFEEMSGKKVRNDNFMYMDDEYDFITANIDRTIVGENAGLECKTMSSFASYDFENGEVPAHYFCQCQHYMMVMGYEKMYLCILVFQRGVFIVDIDRNDEFIKQMREAEIDFWTKHVEKHQMPAPLTEEDREAIKEIYPEERDRNESILIPELETICKEIEIHKEAEKMHKEQIEKLKASITAQLKDVGRGFSDNWKVSWLSQNTTRIDSKKLKAVKPEIYKEFSNTTPSRVLRISKNK